ncbi:MAG: hypothetical protein WCO71_10570, partial [Pseudomonadota bacterium]
SYVVAMLALNLAASVVNSVLLMVARRPVQEIPKCPEIPKISISESVIRKRLGASIDESAPDTVV